MKINTRIFAGMAALTLLFVLVLVGCATKPEAYQDIDLAVQSRNFEAGITAIEKGQERKKPLYDEKNAVSLFLDKGLLEHYAGNYRDSSQDLQRAERLIEEAFTKSVTQEFASYIANDNTKEYPGEDYEDIYLNVFNALNYYHKGDFEGAMVEIRKITLSNGKLDMLSRKYEKGQKSATDGLMKALKTYSKNSTSYKINPDALPKGKPVQFSDSALARYLGALFYQAQGNEDSARIEFELIPAAFNDNPKIYKNAPPRAVVEAQAVPEGKARLNIIGFAGLSPVKVEQKFMQEFPFSHQTTNQTTIRQGDMIGAWLNSNSETKLTLPVLEARPDRIDWIEVSVEGQGVFNLELLEDMGAAMAETYNARFANMFLKTYIRVMLKYAAAEYVPGGQLMANASEQADVRMGKYFPGKAYIGGINLDPGNYTVTVRYYHGGQVIGTDTREVNIKTGALNLLETVNLGGAPEAHGN